MAAGGINKAAGNRVAAHRNTALKRVRLLLFQQNTRRGADTMEVGEFLKDPLKLGCLQPDAEVEIRLFKVSAAFSAPGR